MFPGGFPQMLIESIDKLSKLELIIFPVGILRHPGVIHGKDAIRE
jgi:hypothetical protein